MSYTENRFYRVLRYYYLRFKRLNDDPHALAGGTAIGVLVGLTPTIPLHTPLIILLTLITRTSLLAGILVSWLMFNPFTIFPIYYVSTVIGNFFTPYEINFSKLQLVIDQFGNGLDFLEIVRILFALGFETIIVLFVGGFILSLPFAILSYYCARAFFTYHHLKRIRNS